MVTVWIVVMERCPNHFLLVVGLLQDNLCVFVRVISHQVLKRRNVFR